ncbi:carboxylesterase family protein [Streptomyces sp. ISL-43]|uniref:carboxylesterase/lipase family protein n=1 Tax=Streptomyces sp. ISL-43 TaxID=2819183 RepID=UPI001BE6A25F|nr:carboxylesterase family protein [Streptomyces sp. ISL-43]MBT2447768.1 carboxylesterase family protein [Streptomyces sp. ISL-43]
MRHTRNVSRGFTATALMLATLGVGLGLGPAGPAQAAAGGGAGTVVDTTGGAVRGTSTDGLRSFQGIPYAAPPVGELRWASPQPAAAWTGVREATAPGSPCSQPAGLPIGVPSVVEDCLYLNVTTPAKPAGKRPVIVWIHGGSLMFGSGDLYGPERLAAEGAVVVTINYRLGAMGFLSDPVLKTSGGLGLEDQQAALHWVRANADAFGGDPGNVTITGQSGGGYSVCGHLASPKSAGLFDRAILQSSPCATGGSRTREEAEAEAEATVEHLRKLKACDNHKDTESCLRHTDPGTLMKAYGTWNEPRPIAGTDLMPLAPAEALRTGKFNRVPVLIGVNHDEERGRILGEELGGGPMPPGAYEPEIRKEFGDRADAVLARYPLNRFGSVGEALATVRTDHTWSVPTLDTARLLAKWTPTRMFEFSERETPAWAGDPKLSFEPRASHMSELPYLFDLKLPLFEKLTEQQERLGNRMTDTWVDFAESGKTDWPSFRGGGYVQSLTSGPWKRTEFTKDHDYAFWRNLR